MLQRHLRLAHLIAIAACIEMTIPFRTTDADGHTAAQALARRVRRISESLHTELSLSPQDVPAFVKTVVTDAVLLANRDTSGFTEAEPRQCLSNTWLLLKEADASLATHGVHSLVAYRQALMRMDDFFSRLDPVLIYGQDWRPFNVHCGLVNAALGSWLARAHPDGCLLYTSPSPRD